MCAPNWCVGRRCFVTTTMECGLEQVIPLPAENNYNAVASSCLPITILPARTTAEPYAVTCSLCQTPYRTNSLPESPTSPTGAGASVGTVSPLVCIISTHVAHHHGAARHIDHLLFYFVADERSASPFDNAAPVCSTEQPTNVSSSRTRRALPTFASVVPCMVDNSMCTRGLAARFPP